jgi:hypothetical protein
MKFKSTNQSAALTFFKRLLILWTIELVISVCVFTFTGCSGGSSGTNNSNGNTATNTPTNTTTNTSGNTNTSGATTNITSTRPAGVSFDDIAYDISKATKITLNGNSITVYGNGVSVNGSAATIISTGTYDISGSLTDGQLIVDTLDAGDVRLILDGMDITCSNGPPVYVGNAERVVMVFADGKSNNLTDGTSYAVVDAEGEPNAALFSHDDLVFYGGGSLKVKANYKDGIKSKDGLIINGGNIDVTSADDGIIGKNYLDIADGNITIVAGGDGLKSTNVGDESQGYVYIADGLIDIDAGADAVQAETDVVITGGDFNITAGGGSSNRVSTVDATAKGIKASEGIFVDGGAFIIDSADDAFNSNLDIVINGGTFNLSVFNDTKSYNGVVYGEDGIHADENIVIGETINDVEINIPKTYEGIESKSITINNGNIRIIASDDGINTADGSGTMATTNYPLYINGGYIFVNAGGDGIDVGGPITMTDGKVIVNGPTNNGNGALDYNANQFKITGGFIIAAGSSGMAMAPGGGSSTQYSMLLNFTAAQTAGKLFRIQKADGTDIVTFAPSKTYQSVAFSSPALANGASYSVYTGGSSTGTATDGLYQSGTYSSGTVYKTFTVSSLVTTVK